jgi:hypothetical protein
MREFYMPDSMATRSARRSVALGLRVSKPAGSRVRKLAGLQVCKFTGLQGCRCAVLQVQDFASSLVRAFAGLGARGLRIREFASMFAGSQFTVLKGRSFAVALALGFAVSRVRASVAYSIAGCMNAYRRLICSVLTVASENRAIRIFISALELRSE